MEPSISLDLERSICASSRSIMYVVSLLLHDSRLALVWCMEGVLFLSKKTAELNSESQ